MCNLIVQRNQNVLDIFKRLGLIIAYITDWNLSISQPKEGYFFASGNIYLTDGK